MNSMTFLLALIILSAQSAYAIKCLTEKDGKDMVAVDCSGMSICFYKKPFYKKPYTGFQISSLICRVFYVFIYLNLTLS